MSQHLLDKLNTGIKAMHLDVPEQVSEKLIDYIGLLTHWNKAFNLTAIRDPEEMVSKHLLDSLAVLPFVGSGRVADVGSGAGLPGIPLALCLPETEFVLIDSNGKKARFLSQARMMLGLNNVEVVNQQIEDYHPKPDSPKMQLDAVIARAYASVSDILKTTAHLHQPQTRILVMHGKLDQAILDKTINTPGYDLKKSHILNVYGLDAARHLLEIVKI